MILALVLGSILFIGPAPRLLARAHWLRRSPRAALFLWQAISISGVLCALAVGPVAVFTFPAALSSHGTTRALVLGSLVITALMLARLIVSGHLVGTKIRAARTEQRQLVDLVATHHDSRMRIVDAQEPGAYCLPSALRDRVVITQGTLNHLDAPQLDAVLAHEYAHLRERHDLILEFFTVLHAATPLKLRPAAALDEVRLLVEVLADRSAWKVAGRRPLAQALVALAAAPLPRAAMGAGPQAVTRIELLSLNDLPRPVTAVLYGTSFVIVAAPILALTIAVIP